MGSNYILWYTICSYALQLFCSPFVVVLDHKKKALVIAIRGTLSIEVMYQLDHLAPYTAHSSMYTDQTNAIQAEYSFVPINFSSHNFSPPLLHQTLSAVLSSYVMTLSLCIYFILVFSSSQDAITSMSVSLTRLYSNESPLDMLNTQVHEVGYITPFHIHNKQSHTPGSTVNQGWAKGNLFPEIAQ